MFNATSIFFFYNYTLQNIYNTTPSIAVGTYRGYIRLLSFGGYRLQRTVDVYASTKKLIGGNGCTIPVGPRRQDHLDSTAVQLYVLVQTRFRVRGVPGRYIGIKRDTANLLYSNLTSFSITTPVQATSMLTTVRVLISGMRMFANKTSTSTSNFELSAASVASNQTHLFVTLVKSTGCVVDMVWLSYVRIVMQLSQYDIKIVSSDYVAMTDKAVINVNPSNTIFSLGAYLLGAVSLNISSTPTQFKTSIDLRNNFTLATSKTPTASIGVWYILVERHPKYFCANCPTASIF